MKPEPKAPLVKELVAITRDELAVFERMITLAVAYAEGEGKLFRDTVKESRDILARLKGKP